MIDRRTLLTTGIAGIAGLGPALGQVPPSPDEVAAYRDLHRAAHSGDVAAIASLVRAGADPNARDGAGRTPLHVAWSGPAPTRRRWRTASMTA
jgi:uncharacterized protein